ncbi:S-layer homology domain-containing protein [Oscillibacter sp.]|uniref:S-layer homology domain-containing protein n=1 Tax=Oscillibacter sp. TaxID=1945593 RepID=UPI0028B215B8|nr:S-layer homology domain-containing protein [Oscillibacter sp.]
MSETGVFSTDHFSTYGVAYKSGFNVADINGHWAKEEILFVANRGLMTGTSATTFSPNGSMTRRTSLRMMLKLVRGRLLPCIVFRWRVSFNM